MVTKLIFHKITLSFLDILLLFEYDPQKFKNMTFDKDKRTETKYMHDLFSDLINCRNKLPKHADVRPFVLMSSLCN